MREIEPVVFVNDDDEMIRDGIQSLIRSLGLRVKTFASAQDFMRSKRDDAPALLVLEVRMPGLSGLDLQPEMSDAGIRIPIVFITGHGDIPMSVRVLARPGDAGISRWLLEQADSERRITQGKLRSA
jgi:FixJ family two-component response regulator